MDDYHYLINYLEKLLEKWGKDLGIEHCEVRISDYSFKSPRASSYSIQVPIQYLELLNSNCNLILRNKNIFTNIGDAANEKLNKESFVLKDLTLTLGDFIKDNNLSAEIYEAKPIDPIRIDAAKMLGLLMNTFIMYHELGHVRQLNFDKRISRTNIEFGEQVNDSLKWTEQAEEVDADVFAINFLWQDVFHNINNFRLEKVFQTKEELLKLALYSIFLFFYMSNTSDEINNPTKEHPHPIVRFSIVANFLQEICLSNNIFNNIQDFNKCIQAVLREFDNTLTYHFNLPDSHHYYKRFYDPEVAAMRMKFQYLVTIDPSLNFNRPYKLQ